MKVLIVDDEPLVRRSLQKAFERMGHQIQVAEDGLVGLEKWHEFLPDVVFLDVLMPQMTGPQLLEKIDVASRNKTKVVMMSAYSGHQEPGLADRFVAKPFEDVFDLVKLAERLISDG